MKTRASIHDIMDAIEAMEVHASWQLAREDNRRERREAERKLRQNLKRMGG